MAQHKLAAQAQREFLYGHGRVRIANPRGTKKRRECAYARELARWAGLLAVEEQVRAAAPAAFRSRATAKTLKPLKP